MKKKQYFVFFLLVILLGLGMYFYFNRDFKKDNLSIVFKQIEKVERGEEVDPISLIASSSSTKILYPKIDTSKPGTISLTFIAIGENGQQKEFLKTLEIVDPTPPVLTLKESKVIIKIGDKFSAEEYVEKSYDDFDGELKVKISDSFDINKVGSYTITYEICDSSENIVKKNLILEVIEKSNPPETNNNEGTNNQPNNLPPLPQPTLPPDNPSNNNNQLPAYSGQTTWLFADGDTFASANAKCDSAGVSSGKRWTCNVLTDANGIHIGYQLVFR